MYWLMDNRVRKALFIIAFVIVSWFVFVPWIILGIGLNALPDPPQPQVTHGEFPIKLVYEIDGVRKIIKDTLICDYNGIEINEGQGKYITWKRKYSSENKAVILLHIKDGGIIYFYPGYAGYYMGEPGRKLENEFPQAHYYRKTENYTEDRLLEKDELYKQYKIKLIEWEPPKPIVNSFK